MDKKKKNQPRSFMQKLLWLSDSSASIHELISFSLLLIMAFQPLQGLFNNAVTNEELIVLFLGRAGLIRALGYGLLLNALVYYVRRMVTFGNAADTLKQTFIKRPWNSFFLLLLIWSLFCIGFAANKNVAVSGDAVRYEGILSYIAYAGFFAGAALVRDASHRRILFVSMGSVAVLLGVLSVIRFFSRTDLFLSYMDATAVGGLSGTFVNTNHYGYYLCTMAAVLFGSAILVPALWQRALCVFGGVSLCVILLVNNTMGSILAVAVGAILLLLFCAIRKGGRAKLAVYGGLAAVVLIIAALVVFANAHPEANKLTRDVSFMLRDAKNILSGNITGAEGSSRVGIWKADLQLIKDAPLTGCGTDNAFYAIEPYYGIQKMPHNEYLAMFVNLGIPGGSLYLLALLSLLFARLPKLRRWSDTTLVAGCTCFTYAISAFFGVSLCTMLPFFYMCLQFFADDAVDLPAIEKPGAEKRHARA